MTALRPALYADVDDAKKRRAVCRVWVVVVTHEDLGGGRAIELYTERQRHRKEVKIREGVIVGKIAHRVHVLHV